MIYLFYEKKKKNIAQEYEKTASCTAVEYFLHNVAPSQDACALELLPGARAPQTVLSNSVSRKGTPAATSASSISY